jgi:transcription elongation factor Elf1
MNAPAELRVAPMQPRRFPLPHCPECNDLLFAPAASEHVTARHVRHLWSCEACGHEFETSVRLTFRRVRSDALS